MKLATFEIDERISYGVVKNDGVVDAGARLSSQFPDLRAVISAGAFHELEQLATHGRVDYKLSEIRLLKPIPNPGKILCVGVNYPGRAEEYKDNSEQPKYPSIFVRLPASLVAHEEPIVRPPESNQLDYEGEIALVVGPPGPAHREKARRSSTSRATPFAMKARSGTGCATENSTSHREKTSKEVARWGPGW